jgi:hypothetical protein
VTTFDGSSGGDLLIQPPIDESIVHFSEQEVVISSASNTTAIEDDVNFDVYTTSVVENRVTVSVSNAPIRTIECTANGSVSGNVVSRVTDGAAIITVRMPNIRKGKQVVFARTSPSSYQTFSSWVAGSLAEHCADQITSRITAATADDVATWMPQFSLRNTAGGLYARNPSSWASDIDLTAIPANCPGIAITPRHLLVVTHYSGSGDIHFVDGDNNTITRTRSSLTEVPGIYDLSIVTMNSDLPEEITPAKLFPADAEDYLPNLLYAVPGLCSNQFRDCLVKASYGFYQNSTMYYTESRNATELLFEKNIIVGDSGSPAGFVIHNEFVPMILWSTGGSDYGGGYTPHKVISAINTITSAVGSHTVDVVDLTEFNNYG